MNGSIITTAQAAKILGVSARTAQLWIESGIVPSWKTPGGHRRMFETDVVAVLDRNDSKPGSPRVLVLAPSPQHRLWSLAFAEMAVTQVSFVDNPIAAAVALGASVPDVLVVQVEQLHELFPDFLTTLRAIPLLSRLQIVIATPLPVEAISPVLGPDLRYKLVHLENTSDRLAHALVQQTQLKYQALLPLPPELREAAFPVGANEARRLLAVHQSGILDSAPEEALDNIAQLAALSLSMPIVLITVVSHDRQWFKARVGLDLTETPRSWAFCNYTILQSGIQEFSDMDADPRFADNPAVAGEPYFRYYAGAPITDDQGFALGSLCVIDTKPRKLSAAHTQILGRLARQVSSEIVRGMRKAADRP